MPDVEASLKRHEDFSATLTAQEERVGALLEMANRLVDAGHYSSDTIQDRKDKVVQAREKLKDKSAKKRGELDASKLFQEFRTEVGEMNNFVAEKSKLVQLPHKTPILRQVQGKVKARKEWAKRSAALEVIRLLHQKGSLMTH